jgi:hypothetical protein
MVLQPLDFEPAGDEGGRPDYHRFLGTTQTALRLPAGRTQVLCTEIDDTLDEAIPYEGLWVFTSREPHEGLEAWLDALDARARASDGGLVAYEAARELFAAGGATTRGGSPSPPSPAQLRAMTDSLTAAMLLGELDWPCEDPQRWSAIWPVQR